MLVVQRLAGVLLQVHALDPDRDGLALRHVDDDLALAHDRRFVLADLVALRQVRIEIVLPVEYRLEIDLRLEPKAGADRLLDAFLVDHRQHAGHRRIDQRDMRVRCAAEFGRGAGKQLGVGRHLGMHFHADDDFPVAGCAVDQLGCSCGYPCRLSKAGDAACHVPAGGAPDFQTNTSVGAGSARLILPMVRPAFKALMGHRVAAAIGH